MSTTLICPLTIFTLLAGSGPALADDDCGIGIYFDEAATIRAVDAAPGTVVLAYLALSVPEGSLQLTGFSQMLIHVWDVPDSWVEIRGGGVNDHVPYGGGDLSLEIVWDTPYPVGGVTVVAGLHIPIDDTDPVLIFTSCHASAQTEGPPGDIHWQHCTHCDEMPPRTTLAATINSDHVPVRSECGTWSDIKAMYR